MADRVVIIGGDAAGMSAAAHAARAQARPDLVVFERGRHTSYAACGLPYFLGGLIEDSSRLVARTPDEHRARGIDVRTEHEVTAIDPAGRTVEVRSLASGSAWREPFDQLVIATGATAIRPPFPHIDARGVTALHSIPDAEALDQLIRTRSPRRAVVVGAGYIGLEMAEALLLRGLEVTIVEKLDQPMATLDADMAQRVAKGLAELGLDLRLGVGVEGFDVGSDGWVRAVATDAGPIGCDLAVLGLGVRPNVALARDAGVSIGPSGAIATDARMATSVPGIWAAGDCAESFHRVSRRPVSIALGTHANKQGRVVGINLTGGRAEFAGVIGTAITKVCDLEIARTGLNEREASAAALEVRTATIDGTARAHFYPEPQPMSVKIVTERDSGRLLGAQIVGRAGAGKRIDALAVAIWNGMTADEFFDADLAYAPPFSPVLDPTLVAAHAVTSHHG